MNISQKLITLGLAFSLFGSTCSFARQMPHLGFPTPIAAKPAPMPTSASRGERLGKPEGSMGTSEEMDEEPAIATRKLGPSPQFAAQDDQLMSKRRILRLKAALRLERRGQYGQNEADQRDHRANLANSIIR